MELEKKKKKGTENSTANHRLLQELEVLSTALYSNTKSQRSISAGKLYPRYLQDTSKSRIRKENPPPIKEKKPSSSSSSSFWKWKPLKALSSHARSHRFNCCFSLHVHSIEFLPPNFDGKSLRVMWKRRDNSSETCPTRVYQGIAEFDETLTHECLVHGTRNGPHHSAKYEGKHSLLYAVVEGAPAIDLGKHRVDLTRLLPLTLEELEGEKSSGKWTTSFSLSGRAEGATLNVSFGYLILRDEHKGAFTAFPTKNPSEKVKNPGPLQRVDSRTAPRRLGSLHLPAKGHPLRVSRSVDGAKILHEVTASLKVAVPDSLEHDTSSTKCDPLEVNLSKDSSKSCQDAKYPLDHLKENDQEGTDEPIFDVIDRGVEFSHMGAHQNGHGDQMNAELMMPVRHGKNEASIASLLENMATCSQGLNELENVSLLVKDSCSALDVKNEHMEPGMVENTYIANNKTDPPAKIISVSVSDCDEGKTVNLAIKEPTDTSLHNLSVFEVSSPESYERQDHSKMDPALLKSNNKMGKRVKSLSLDDVTESVANEFLDMLGMEHSPFAFSSDSDPESPRECLWRQFRRESLAGGAGIFDFDFATDLELEPSLDVQFGSAETGDDNGPSFHLATTAVECQKAEQVRESKEKAKMLEDLESRELMREWGLNDEVFQASDCSVSAGFGSPINSSHGEPSELPSLGEGLGPFVRTRNGGFLKSMNPSLFKNTKNRASLLMQVSSPVVVPAEMGSGVMDILQRLASVGIEKLTMQASRLMPLEDIAGKTMQQVAWESIPDQENNEREKCKGKVPRLGLSSSTQSSGSEYVSLEELAPLAMDKIEALTIEGLRIQSGMTDEAAPSNIFPQSVREISALEGTRANDNLLDLEGAAGLQLLNLKHDNDDLDGLMSLSLSLDEWMKLDAGIVDYDDQNGSRTSKILAAHHANCTAEDLIKDGYNNSKRGSKGKKWGILGNNFTVALMVQLRDPLRNYEPVGTPMLALIQVERVFAHPKVKLTKNLFGNENVEKSEENDASNLTKEEKKVEKLETTTMFKITECHVAGLKAETAKKKLWGSSTQQQSGSRWLLATGMGKSSKHPLLKSKAGEKSLQVSASARQPGDKLWSVSSSMQDVGSKWKGFRTHQKRNPNIMFPSGAGKLK